MPRPFPRRTYHRAAAMRRGLDPIIHELDALTDRRGPMTASLRGRGWRAIEHARKLLGMPPVPASAEREKPAELVVEILSVFARLATLKPLHRLATPGVRQKSYPRALERE
jgi:hypothetical protein